MLELLSNNLFYKGQAQRGRNHSKLQDCLDRASFDAAFTEGWELSEEQAIELVEELLGGDDSPSH